MAPNGDPSHSRYLVHGDAEPVSWSSSDEASIDSVAAESIDDEGQEPPGAENQALDIWDSFLRGCPLQNAKLVFVSVNVEAIEVYAKYADTPLQLCIAHGRYSKSSSIFKSNGPPGEAHWVEFNHVCSFPTRMDGSTMTGSKACIRLIHCSFFPRKVAELQIDVPQHTGIEKREEMLFAKSSRREIGKIRFAIELRAVQKNERLDRYVSWFNVRNHIAAESRLASGTTPLVVGRALRRLNGEEYVAEGILGSMRQEYDMGRPVDEDSGYTSI